MKSVFTLLLFTVATFSGKKPGRRHMNSSAEQKSPGTLTDEIRRYDIDDLILQ